MLEDMPPHTVFATGETVDSPKGINMTNSGTDLRWVAVRGEIWDWAIYIHHAEHNAEWIKRHGDKVCNKHNIQKLVECDQDAFNSYRY